MLSKRKISYETALACELALLAAIREERSHLEEAIKLEEAICINHHAKRIEEYESALAELVYASWAHREEVRYG